MYKERGKQKAKRYTTEMTRPVGCAAEALNDWTRRGVLLKERSNQH